PPPLRSTLFPYTTLFRSFFGDLLVRRLLADGLKCVSLDLERTTASHADLRAVRGDIRDRKLLDELFGEHRFSAVFHCAAMLAHTDRKSTRLNSSHSQISY